MDTETETSHPVREQARNELADIMTNPHNPRYEGFKRGDKAVMEYVEQIYKPTGTGKVVIGGESLSSHPVNLSGKPAAS